MNRDIVLEEALFEICESIKHTIVIPEKLPPANNCLRFSLEFPSGTPLKLDVECVDEENGAISYLVSACSGMFRSREKADDCLDKAINNALWELVARKFTHCDLLNNPYDSN